MTLTQQNRNTSISYNKSVKPGPYEKNVYQSELSAKEQKKPIEFDCDENFEVS